MGFLANIAGGFGQATLDKHQTDLLQRLERERFDRQQQAQIDAEGRAHGRQIAAETRQNEKLKEAAFRNALFSENEIISSSALASEGADPALSSIGLDAEVFRKKKQEQKEVNTLVEELKTAQQAALGGVQPTKEQVADWNERVSQYEGTSHSALISRELTNITLADAERERRDTDELLAKMSAITNPTVSDLDALVSSGDWHPDSERQVRAIINSNSVNRAMERSRLRNEQLEAATISAVEESYKSGNLTKEEARQFGLDDFHIGQLDIQIQTDLAGIPKEQVQRNHAQWGEVEAFIDWENQLAKYLETNPNSAPEEFSVPRPNPPSFPPSAEERTILASGQPEAPVVAKEQYLRRMYFTEDPKEFNRRVEAGFTPYTEKTNTALAGKLTYSQRAFQFADKNFRIEEAKSTIDSLMSDPNPSLQTLEQLVNASKFLEDSLEKALVSYQGAAVSAGLNKDTYEHAIETLMNTFESYFKEIIPDYIALHSAAAAKRQTQSSQPAQTGGPITQLNEILDKFLSSGQRQSSGGNRIKKSSILP